MARLLKFFEKEQEEAIEAQRQIRHRLGKVELSLDLFKHPAWPGYEADLRNMEAADVEIVVGGGEDADAARERIRVVRHLLRIPQDLEAERARLSDLMAAGPESEE